LGLLTAIGTGPVALDSSIFIYFIEEHPKYLPLLEPLFQAIDGGRLEAVTSSVTLLEVLVQPLRSGNTALAEQYEALLTRGRGLTLVGIDLRLLRTAAHLRAAVSLRTPDALQVAAAMITGCSALLTNDQRLPATPGLPVLQLERYLSLED
jgi:predicted nucleic acid-binding protein